MSFFSFICLSALATAMATVGVDVSQRTPLESWQCVKNYDYDFAIIRVYMSNGYCDSNGPANINDAWNAGMSRVDGYIFPCYSCGNAVGQMDSTIDYLASNNVRLAKVGEAKNATLGASVNMLWIDVEGTEYWSGDQGSNVDFISQMVDQGKARGVSIGIYSSVSNWSPITGDSSAFSSLPIWYAHYDSDYSFNDWQSFGGWESPTMKQYSGDQSFCSAGWDKNYIA